MAIGATLFLLRTDSQGAFDGSTKGIGLTHSAKVKLLGPDLGFRLMGEAINLARHPALDGLQSFTIEAKINPDAVGDVRQNIIEAQTPAVALFIEAKGKLVGSINTSAGWVGVDSGTNLVNAGVENHVIFSRKDDGRMELQINGKAVGSKLVPGPIKSAGNSGFKIGKGVDGKKYAFSGIIADLRIRQGVVSPQFFEQKSEAAKRIEQTFKAKTGLSKVSVNLIPDYGDSRLQPIKDIMNAAGVKKLSDLDTLQIKVRTAMAPGKVLIAPQKLQVINVVWSAIAESLQAANDEEKRHLVARVLTNRNSAAALKKMQVAAPVAGALSSTTNVHPIERGGRVTGVGSRATTGLRVPAEVLRASPTLRLAAKPIRVQELFKEEGTSLKLANKEVLSNLESSSPALWANTSAPTVQLCSLKTIPVNSAVMIGSTIDLTDTELVIEPSVSTLYLIADKLICGNNAKITWKRPGGETPPRLDNPDLNGRDYWGIQTRPNSRDGLDGEDGRSGESGIGGAAGLNAPNLEIWVKEMSAMPILDLNGEDGRKGGRGQRGGRGGRGADGANGVAKCFIWGCWCSEENGDGGAGGDGGNGGRGGRGGTGGNGGKITITVLEDTLESTVTNRRFKSKNQGGQRGRGGDGGSGGNAGPGGHGGTGGVTSWKRECEVGRNGPNGSKGQPGSVGPDGSNLGNDGEWGFYEFSLDEWNALMTRPWITEVAPNSAFSGDSLTLRGSKFSSGDRVAIAGSRLAPVINSDESISITVPPDIAGGLTSVYVCRQDGTESNRCDIWIKPQLDPFRGALNPGATVTLTGRAFVTRASVLVNGEAIPSNVISRTQLTFAMPGTGGSGGGGNAVSLQVRNPDGMMSNSRTASIPRILEIPFRYGTHNLPFENFSDGIPDWETYKDTFGEAEIWLELTPIFGHPILTNAFFGFYCLFLKGEDNGGLATGFCTSMASLVADNFWQGRTDTHTITKASVHKLLTTVHGKLLSRESLLCLHDQGRAGVSSVETIAREIEATFLRGCDRNNAPLLFFIPMGEIWDSGYFDKLGSSHCVMPWRFVYPDDHRGPRLAPGGATTLTDLDGVEMYVWDCNKPESPNCKLVFRVNRGRIDFEYFPDSSTAKFSSQNGITLGMMTNGDYMLADHDLPFSGPFGLTTFIADFLMSPADLQITDQNGLRTGNFGGQILSEIPDSHPFYLVPGAYLLPTNTPLTRHIVGTGTGKYAFNSIMPDGGSLTLEEVPTSAGQVDELSVSSDATQLRFTPATEKTFHLTVARQVSSQARAIAIRGIGGGPSTNIDITLSPELSLIRIGNRGPTRNVEVRAFVIDRKDNRPINKKFAGVRLPVKHDLIVAVKDWVTLDASVKPLSFQ